MFQNTIQVYIYLSESFFSLLNTIPVKRSEAKPTITSQEGASYSPPFDKFVVPPREPGGFIKVRQHAIFKRYFR